MIVIALLRPLNHPARSRVWDGQAVPTRTPRATLSARASLARRDPHSSTIAVRADQRGAEARSTDCGVVSVERCRTHDRALFRRLRTAVPQHVLTLAPGVRYAGSGKSTRAERRNRWHTAACAGRVRH